MGERMEDNPDPEKQEDLIRQQLYQTPPELRLTVGEAVLSFGHGMLIFILCVVDIVMVILVFADHPGSGFVGAPTPQQYAERQQGTFVLTCLIVFFMYTFTCIFYGRKSTAICRRNTSLECQLFNIRCVRPIAPKIPVLVVFVGMILVSTVALVFIALALFPKPQT
jgi:hypothetical protein